MLHFVTNALGQPIGRPLPNWKPAARPVHQVMMGEWCRLEPLNLQRHAQSLYEANALDGRGASWTYLPYGPFDSRDAYFQWIESQALSQDPLLFAIVNRQSGSAEGIAGYLRIQPEIGSIEVGHVHFSPRLQRATAATEAMFLMAQAAFGWGYRRYEWKCDALNQASRAAALRLGFQFEGIFRQATVYKGRSRDTAWYSIIDEEWPSLEARFRRWLAPENFSEAGVQKSRLSDKPSSAAST